MEHGGGHQVSLLVAGEVGREIFRVRRGWREHRRGILVQAAPCSERGGRSASGREASQRVDATELRFCTGPASSMAVVLSDPATRPEQSCILVRISASSAHPRSACVQLCQPLLFAGLLRQAQREGVAGLLRDLEFTQRSLFIGVSSSAYAPFDACYPTDIFVFCLNVALSISCGAPSISPASQLRGSVGGSYDCTPFNVRFGQLTGVMQDHARYLVLDENGRWTAVPLSDFEKKSKCRAAPQVLRRLQVLTTMKRKVWTSSKGFLGLELTVWPFG